MGGSDEAAGAGGHVERAERGFPEGTGIDLGPAHAVARLPDHHVEGIERADGSQCDQLPTERRKLAGGDEDLRLGRP